VWMLLKRLRVVAANWERAAVSSIVMTLPVAAFDFDGHAPHFVLLCVSNKQQQHVCHDKHVIIVEETEDLLQEMAASTHSYYLYE